MRKHGGFDHNEQSLRIVDVIETALSEFPRAEPLLRSARGIAKARALLREREARREAHRAAFARSADRESRRRNHLLQPRPRRRARLPLFSTRSSSPSSKPGSEHARRKCARNFPKLKGAGASRVCHSLHHRPPGADVIRTSSARIDAAGVRSADDVRAQREAAHRVQRRAAPREPCSSGNSSTRISTTTRASPARTSRVQDARRCLRGVSEKARAARRGDRAPRG